MPTISILNIATDKDNLIVTGTVDGITVKGHGWTSRFNKLPSDQRKLNYLEDLLKAAAAVTLNDVTLIQKYLKSSFKVRLRLWFNTRYEYILISSGVFGAGLIVRHLCIDLFSFIGHLFR